MTRIIVIHHDGFVQSVTNIPPDVEVEVRDYDAADIDEEYKSDVYSADEPGSIK